MNLNAASTIQTPPPPGEKKNKQQKTNQKTKEKKKVGELKCTHLRTRKKSPLHYCLHLE